jgi:lipopolysaccharide transport system ATP-binding protein
VSAEVLLQAEGLGKAYPANAGPRARLSALGRILLGRDIARIPVLQDIAFTVRRGESLGIVGENGAGKSTLLKLVSGVLHPTYGNVTRRGSVGALIELGAGFELEHTGRQNIATSAALMGWSADDVARRQPEIEAFADIGRYLDEPIKHYSSGMVVRLGFAIMATLRPDLIITDEVLAVGDESFQKKCIRWMEDYLEGGGTLLLVSHSMYHIQKLCRHALWLKDGRMQAYGDVFDVTQDYLAYHERKSLREVGADLEPGYHGPDYRVVEVEINGSPDADTRLLRAGDALAIRVVMHTPETREPHLGLGIVRADGSAVFGTTSEIDGARARRLGKDRVEYRLEFETGALLPGSYCLRLHALDPECVRLFDTVERGFSIRGASRELGLVRVAHHWHDGG